MIQKYNHFFPQQIGPRRLNLYGAGSVAGPGKARLTSPTRTATYDAVCDQELKSFNEMDVAAVGERNGSPNGTFSGKNWHLHA